MRSGMRPLLPELIFVRFVRSPVMPKLIEQPFAAFDLDLLDELFGGEALQIAQDGGETVRKRVSLRISMSTSVWQRAAWLRRVLLRLISKPGHYTVHADP
jgi:hypothetical protein